MSVKKNIILFFGYMIKAHGRAGENGRGETPTAEYRSDIKERGEEHVVVKKLTRKTCGGEQDKKGGSRRQRDHRPVCDGKVISPYESALSWEIPIILKALVSWHQAEQGVRQVCQLRGDEQYSINRQMKAL